jgi:hypothetical protein
VRPSRGTVGDVYDNAMAESYIATLECERLDRRGYRTHVEAKLGPSAQLARAPDPVGVSGNLSGKSDR